MSIKANKGEWGEPYAAIRILGDGKLYIADANGNKNPSEWMNVLELIRHETASRIVSYRYKAEEVEIDVFVNNSYVTSFAASEFIKVADQLAREIPQKKGNSFEISDALSEFMREIEMLHIKAKSVDKSDIFLTILDPRASVMREHIGFSIKSEFGQNPTLFNTAKSSAVVYEVLNMNDNLMDKINSMFDDKGHVSVGGRCDALISDGCDLKFIGFPIASNAKCAAFKENLDLINPRLAEVIERMLWNHFFNHESYVNLEAVTQTIIKDNPCMLTRPEEKYPYMIKSFLYAAYCGMTASTLWNGNSQVNGGFIKVKRTGEVVAHYALESDAFKSYLYKNCYLEFPSTSEKHGFYANVYKEDGKYYFRLNFQIRYR